MTEQSFHSTLKYSVLQTYSILQYTAITMYFTVSMCDRIKAYGCVNIVLRTGKVAYITIT